MKGVAFMGNETIAALMGAIVGGVLTISGESFREARREARKSEQISHAIAGEISALLQIVEARGYLAAIRSLRALALSGTAEIFQAPIDQTYFSVIEANLQNIGMLPVELPLLIPKFLTLSKSALEDASALNAGKWTHFEASQLAIMYDGLRQVLEEAVATGREIVTLIATIYGSPHGRYPPMFKLRMLFKRRCTFGGDREPL
jgi:hypothetical protein